MARFEFRLPDIGEGVAEGEVVAWHVKPGDIVKEDDPMVEVMTDKATVTIGAPKSGKIVELGGAVGAVVKVGAVLVAFEVGAGAEAAPVAAAPSGKVNGTHAASQATPAAQTQAQADAASKAAGGPAATAVGDIRESLPGSGFFKKKAENAAAATAAGHAHVAASASAPAMPAYFSERPLATPATRKLARDIGVDLRHVPPTGENGRVTKADVHGFSSTKSSNGNSSHATASAGTDTSGARQMPSSGRALVSIQAPTASDQALEDRKPFIGMRRKIAERLQISKNTAAHFTFVEECDVAELKALHKRMKPGAEARGVKLSFLPFIVKAVVAALKKTPVLNSALDETTNELVTRRYYNIGIAAATDQGLMVPVVRNADRLSIAETAAEIDRLGNGARAGTLSSAELTGSTFTITSLGKQGGLFATPVLNFPEVGILGVHQIKQKPVVKNGEIVIGEIMLLSLSFDHRIVDGHIGAAFAYDIIHYLEHPDQLFLDMS
ncbi:MAG: 2-oxo acid dehydrogenase subunit E2 [Sandaracinaceae bacterium]|jgi:pyruvate dehydrogenase E2 component (dihydrolipoamide acetyltransferase)|nr:2-oxo acid dehydrogenase subunit E2 [Sandaracinaceae bacterium]